MDVSIRKWRATDAEDLAKVINNKRILDNLRDGIPFPYTLKDAKEFIDLMLNANADDTFAWAITVEDIVVGSIGIYRKNNIHNCTAELGYYIGESSWRKGITLIAIEKACDFVFNNTDIVRIFAEPFERNIASCKVLERNGFVLEGILQKNALKNGEFLNMKMYAKVK